MGKTAKGRYGWTPKRPRRLNSYQYWRNTDDKDVMKSLRMLTFISLEELAEIENGVTAG